MPTIEKKIQAARPRLADFAPLTNSIVLGFVVFNFGIALSLFINGASSKLIIINDFLTPVFWGLCFIFVALMLLWGHRRNNWELIRRGFIFGLALKAVFLYALLQLGTTIGFKALMGTIILWLFTVHIQAMALIYFAPNVNGGKNERP